MIGFCLNRACPALFFSFCLFYVFLCFSYFLFFFAYVLATNERMKKQQQIKITLRCLRFCWFCCILLYFSLNRGRRIKHTIKENTNKQNENEREEQKKNYDEQRRRRRRQSGHVNAYLTFIYDLIRNLFSYD